MIQSKNKKTNDYDSCFIVHNQTTMKFGEHKRNVKVDLQSWTKVVETLEIAIIFSLVVNSPLSRRER